MQFVLVGLGFWGKSWAALLRNDPQATLVGVVDPGESATEWAEGTLEIPHFRTLTEALRELATDAVVIVTPPFEHAAGVIEALAYGKHVLLEKPMAPHMADAIRIQKAAAESTGRVMVAQGYRFLDGAREIRKLLESRFLGELQSIRIHFRQSLAALFGTRTDHPLYALQHSILIDMAVHHFDLVRYVTQREIAKVSGFEYQTPENILTHPSNAVCHLTLENGVSILWDGDWSICHGLTCWEGEWEIIGKNARLFWRGDLEKNEYKSSIWTQEPNKPRVQTEFTESVTDRRSPVLNHFIQSINEGEQPQPGITDNIRTLAAVFGCIESIEKKTEIWLSANDEFRISN
jgi:predicted dehydrogenase